MKGVVSVVYERKTTPALVVDQFFTDHTFRVTLLLMFSELDVVIS